jgi:hypothetical protein
LILLILGWGIPLFKGISGTFLSPPLLFDVIYSFDVMQLLYNFSHDYVILCNNFRDAIYDND